MAGSNGKYNIILSDPLYTCPRPTFPPSVPYLSESQLASATFKRHDIHLHASLSENRAIAAGFKGVNAYDERLPAELTEFLNDQNGAFDLILSADTLCYFGDLTLVFLGATHALRSGGMLAFTLQDAGDKTVNWQLNCQGRYSHSQGCVTRMAKDSGFSLIRFDSVILRKEGGEPVEGHLVVATI